MSFNLWKHIVGIKSSNDMVVTSLRQPVVWLVDQQLNRGQLRKNGLSFHNTHIDGLTIRRRRGEETKERFPVTNECDKEQAMTLTNIKEWLSLAKFTIISNFSLKNCNRLSVIYLTFQIVLNANSWGYNWLFCTLEFLDPENIL